MQIRPVPLLLLVALAVPVFADDVYLVNGRKFEGVIAETSGAQIRIRMQGGVLSLPKDQVERIEAGDSNLAEYLRRKEALKKSPAARAADWLELARWARGKELDQAAREAALAGAALDPKLEGLAGLLRGYGYVFDPQLDRFVPYADSMRRRGFVLAGGQWITRDEYQAKLRVQEEDQARNRAAREAEARENRLAALAELSVVRGLSQPAPPPYPLGYDDSYYGIPLGVFSGWWGPVTSPQRPSHHAVGGSEFTHIPGSLIPGRIPGLR
jgi:hypothetical protein